MKPDKTAPACHTKRVLPLALALLLFAPLLFLNIRSDHDWGDDFAQYLAQAENIAQHKPMHQTGYVYNEFYPSLGPRAYPPGFPLIIAPMVKYWGNHITPYNYLTSIILLLTSLLTVVFLKRQSGWLPALAMSLMVFYNPYVIELKAEVMSDIPFALLVILFLLLTAARKTPASAVTWIISGLIAGFAIAVKTAGMILPAGLVMFAGWMALNALIRKEKFSAFLKEAAGPLLSAAVALVFYFILNLIFMRGTAGASSYLNTFSLQSLSQTIAMNLYTYTEVLRKFFIDIHSGVFWFGFLAGSAAVTFTITGLIIAIRRGPGLMEWIFLAYLGLLLVYPYHNAGFRFLLPVAPLIIAYIATAVAALKPGRGEIAIFAGVAVMMIATYLPSLLEVQQSTRETREGPYGRYSRDAFSNVKDLVPDDALVVFIKPRVLARFAGKNSMAFNPDSTPAEVYRQSEISRPTHFLLYTELPDPALEHYLRTNRRETEMIWQNRFFRLYRRRAE